MRYLKEFPDYDDEVPLDRFPGFVDQSWHNDTCPSFFNQALAMTFYADFVDEEQREFPGGPEGPLKRFTVHRTYDEHGATSDPDNPGEILYQCDSWDELVAWVGAAITPQS
jgi:hypothetical protein